MMDHNTRKQILDLIAQEVVPAVGCTEPMAVALCVARATENLGRRPEKITVMLSANILKNAMGVGIPGTGMIGLPIAIALGAHQPGEAETARVRSIGAACKRGIEADGYFVPHGYFGEDEAQPHAAQFERQET